MMKTMSMLLLLVLLAGCGARGEVAKDKVLAQLDSLLGEIDVRKKEAEIGAGKLVAGLDKLSKGKIEAKVRLAKFSEKATELDEKLALTDKTLGRLREHLQGGQDAQINGKTFSVSQLKEMADKVIVARKKLLSEIELWKSSQQRLEGIVASLEARETEGRERLSKLKLILDEIDAKALALKSMQEAAGLSGDTEALDFEKISKQVLDLSTKIDVELALQDQKAGQSTNDLKSLDSIVQETSTPSDTLSEIDKILGDAK